MHSNSIKKTILNEMGFISNGEKDEFELKSSYSKGGPGGRGPGGGPPGRWTWWGMKEDLGPCRHMTAD